MQPAAALAALSAACVLQAAAPARTAEVRVPAAVRQAEAAGHVRVLWEPQEWSHEYAKYTCAPTGHPIEPVSWLMSVAELAGGRTIASAPSGGGLELRVERFPGNPGNGTPRRFVAAAVRSGVQQLPDAEETVIVERRMRSLDAGHVARALRPLLDASRAETVRADIDRLVVTATAPRAAQLLIILDHIDPPAAGGK